MKKILSAFIACLALASCQTNEKKDSANNSTTDTQKDCVEVICFHNKQRCATCIATEQNTKAAIDSVFAEQLKTGENTIEIVVVNNWMNRHIGDSRLPEKERMTWTNINPWKPDSPLQSSGLLGPVEIYSYQYNNK